VETKRVLKTQISVIRLAQ